jgi:hypothetical protein
VPVKLAQHRIGKPLILDKSTSVHCDVGAHRRSLELGGRVLDNQGLNGRLKELTDS